MPKNFRKIPPNITRLLTGLPDRYLIAACSRTFSASDIRSGLLVHLGVSLQADGLAVPPDVIPPAAAGRASKRNIEGREIIRRDLPKERLYNWVDSPNWGDWSQGSHSVSLPYDRYPRDFQGPRLASIKIDCPDQAPDRADYLLVFRDSEVLDRETDDFEERLLSSVNLLQENVGASGVASASSTLEEYLHTLFVSWEILPPGTREQTLSRLFQGRTPSAEARRRLEERYDFLKSLDPQSLVAGTSGFQRYFGALLAPELVVFDNTEYGNAIYVMFGEWEALSHHSRTDLLSGRYGSNFERIVHAPGWERRVRVLVGQRLGTLQGGIS